MTKVMLPKGEQPYWNVFKSYHSQPITNFVSSILGEEISREEFLETYLKLSLSKVKKNWVKKQRASQLYIRMIKYKWIKPA